MYEKQDITTLREKHEQFKKTVKRLVDIKNAGKGKGHFAEARFQEHGIASFNIDALDEHDMQLLDLFFESLDAAVKNMREHPEVITKGYVDEIEAQRASAQRDDLTPSQQIFHAYLNNKFHGLLGFLDIYTEANDGTTNDKNVEKRNFAREQIDQIGKDYLGLFSGYIV